MMFVHHRLHAMHEVIVVRRGYLYHAAILVASFDLLSGRWQVTSLLVPSIYLLHLFCIASKWLQEKNMVSLCVICCSSCAYVGEKVTYSVVLYHPL